MSNSFEAIYRSIDAKLKKVRALNLTTADGFTIFSRHNSDFSCEKEKLSAVTSSLTALSQAAAKQLMSSEFNSTCIETNNGIMYMVQTRYKNKPCILSLVSGNNPNLGQIRFYLNKLAKFLETASLSAEERQFD